MAKWVRKIANLLILDLQGGISVGELSLVGEIPHKGLHPLRH